MPWRETSSVDQRVQFIADYLTQSFSLAELCRRYGISRPTAYAVIARYEAAGAAGLMPQSRRPHTSPHATPGDVVEALIRLRARRPTWGPVKLLAALRRRAPDRPWPAPSTAGAILKRHGLVVPVRRRPRIPVAPRPLTTAATPNAVWTIDFKGEFLTRDGRWCYPLTLMDACSRYLLACQALAAPRSALVRPVLERAFQEFGLPARIRSDNGVPFAGPNVLARLSRLAVWWIRLGILPELIQPGCPAQNGRHERMHRTLKRETTRPPAGNRGAQQRRFTDFRREYNDERPHAALEMFTPAMVYVPSARPLPAALPALEYPAHFECRRVASDGGIKWRNVEINVTSVLQGEVIGCEEIADGEWALYFGPVRLGTLSERFRRVCPNGHHHGGRAPASPSPADAKS